jgi:hypothetical protein
MITVAFTLGDSIASRFVSASSPMAHASVSSLMVAIGDRLSIKRAELKLGHIISDLNSLAVGLWM